MDLSKIVEMSLEHLQVKIEEKNQRRYFMRDTDKIKLSDKEIAVCSII